MKAAADNDNWRKKYFDNLAQLEKEQQQFRASEVSLKRLVGRLCTAALGQSPKLDDQLKKLQTAIRRDASAEELEKLTPALSEAIQTLDQPGSSTAIPVIANVSPSPIATTTAIQTHENLRPILSAILTELRRDDQLAGKVDTLDSQLDNLAGDRLTEVLSSVSELVSQRIVRIERAKQEVEVLLAHMVGKLDEIGRFVAEQNRSQNESQASSEPSIFNSPGK